MYILYIHRKIMIEDGQTSLKGFSLRLTRLNALDDLLFALDFFVLVRGGEVSVVIFGSVAEYFVRRSFD